MKRTCSEHRSACARGGAGAASDSGTSGDSDGTRADWLEHRHPLGASKRTDCCAHAPGRAREGARWTDDRGGISAWTLTHTQPPNALSRRPSPIRRAASAAHDELLRLSVDRLVLALRSAPTTAPSASPTAWLPSRSSASGAALALRPSRIRASASGAHDEPLRSSDDRRVFALRSAPTTAPSASPTAWRHRFA